MILKLHWHWFGIIIIGIINNFKIEINSNHISYFQSDGMSLLLCTILVCFSMFYLLKCTFCFSTGCPVTFICLLGIFWTFWPWMKMHKRGRIYAGFEEYSASSKFHPFVFWLYLQTISAEGLCSHGEKGQFQDAFLPSPREPCEHREQCGMSSCFYYHLQFSLNWR